MMRSLKHLIGRELRERAQIRPLGSNLAVAAAGELSQ